MKNENHNTKRPNRTLDESQETGTEIIHTDNNSGSVVIHEIDQESDPTKDRGRTQSLSPRRVSNPPTPADHVIGKTNILLEKKYDPSYVIRSYIQWAVGVLVMGVLALFALSSLSYFNSYSQNTISVEQIQQTSLNCYSVLFINRDFTQVEIEDRIRQLKKL